jgi:hypothetical protein
VVCQRWSESKVIEPGAGQEGVRTQIIAETLFELQDSGLYMSGWK